MEEVDKQHQSVGDTDKRWLLWDLLFRISKAALNDHPRWLLPKQKTHRVSGNTSSRQVWCYQTHRLGQDWHKWFIHGWHGRSGSFPVKLEFQMSGCFFVCEGVLDKGISAALWILLSWLLLLVVLFSWWNAMIFAGVYSQYLMSFFLKIVLKLVFKASWNCSHEDRPCPCGNNPRYLKNNSRWIYLKTVACLEACLKVQYLTRIQFSHCKISTLKAVWALTTPHPCRNCQQQPHCSQGWEAWLVTYPTTMGFPLLKMIILGCFGPFKKHPCGKVCA